MVQKLKELERQTENGQVIEKSREATIAFSIRTAVVEVFASQLMLDVRAGDPFHEDCKNVVADVICLHHFFSEQFMGAIAVFYSREVASYLSSAITGEDLQVFDYYLFQCIEQIGCSIIGAVQLELESSLGELVMLNPWVISGEKLDQQEGKQALESHAEFSWLMTQFKISESLEFQIGVQPNNTPESYQKRQAVLADKEQDELMVENSKLQAELAELKVFIRRQ